MDDTKKMSVSLSKLTSVVLSGMNLLRVDTRDFSQLKAKLYMFVLREV